MDFFEKVELLPPDPIFGLMEEFSLDPRKNKVNLGAGVYKTAELKPLILNIVKKAERILIEKESSKDYLPIDGEKSYLDQTNRLVFGNALDAEKIYAAQSVGATAALRIGGAFLKEQGFGAIYLPDPSWENHFRVFSQEGLQVNTYPYYSYKTKSFDFDRLCQFLKDEIQQKGIIVLHAACHNPTGSDPTFEEWEEILKLVVEKKLFPFFDFAYQGFGKGLEEDAKAVRLFASKGIQFACAVSHGKNFGLYAERTGALCIGCLDATQAKKVGSQIKAVIRGIYSNPPCHGARIVSTILQDDELKKHWMNELKAMQDRIEEMRKSLVAKLHVKLPGVNFEYLTKQLGMFSFLGFKKEKMERLTKEFAIYLPNNGRINIAGLNTENMDYVADAIAAICG